MKDTFLMRVLHGATHRGEQAQSRFYIELTAFAEMRERQAIDQFHDVKGPAVGGNAGIEDVGNVRMFQLRERLAFEVEAPRPFCRVEAELKAFQGNFTTHGNELLGEKDFTHAAFADLLQQPIPRRDLFTGRGCLQTFQSRLQQAARA